jgi:hypothetical protein
MAAKRRGNEAMALDHSLTPDRLILERADAEAQCGCEDHDRFVGDLGGTLDDGTIRYVLATRPHFEDLRHAVGQVAGMLVLAAAGAKTVTQDHPLFATARTTLERVSDGIGAAHPSARALHHHRHLVAAVGALGLALKRAQEDLHLHGIDRARVDPVLEPLKTAYRNLAWAAQALPGFALLSFDQACCAPQQSANH